MACRSSVEDFVPGLRGSRFKHRGTAAAARSIRAAVEIGVRRARYSNEPTSKKLTLVRRVDADVKRTGSRRRGRTGLRRSAEHRDLLAAEVADARDAGRCPELLAAGVETRERRDRHAGVDRGDDRLRVAGPTSATPT